MDSFSEETNESMRFLEEDEEQSPFRKIPVKSKNRSTETAPRGLISQLGGLSVVFHALFLITPPLRMWVLVILGFLARVVIVCCSVTANGLTIWKIDVEPFQRFAEAIYIARVVVAYIVTVVYLRKRHFWLLLQEAHEKYPAKLSKMVHLYFFFWLLLVIIGAAATIPSKIDDLATMTGGIHLSKPQLLSILIISSAIYNAIWAVSMVILWLVLHLTANKWSEYVTKLKNGGFKSTSQALLEHSKLTEQLSETNANFEVYLSGTLCVSIATILSCLYISLLPKYISASIWTISFFLDCIFLLAIFIPGSFVTTYTRRVKKISNKLRALMDPHDDRAIAHLDSFLLYLYTNNASMKVAGVTIDLGFMTKLCISLFTVCAFIVQRELAH